MTSHFRILKMQVFIIGTGMCRSWSISGDHSHFKTNAVVEKEFTNSHGSFHLCVLPSLNVKRVLAYVKAAVGCMYNSVFILTQVKQLPQMATYTIIKVSEWQTCTQKGTAFFDGIRLLMRQPRAAKPSILHLGYQCE